MEGSKTPLSCFPADMEGVEPPSSFSCEIEGFRSNMSLDSFSGLPAGESRQERTDALLLTTEVSGFRTHTRTVFFRERRLLLTLESPSGLSTAGSSLTSRLLELALLLGGCLTISGRLEGCLMVSIGIHHGVSPPLRRELRQKIKS